MIQPVPRTRMVGRRGILPCLVVVCLAVGCQDRSPDAVRLMVLSPHRDEIREEVGRAFGQWFQQRTQLHIQAACAALRRAIETGSTTRLSAPAVDELFADWHPDDLPDVWPAYQAWDRQPTREHARTLLAGLDAWQQNPRPITVIWLDVGGGTSAIARYISARFDTVGPNDGVGVDLLFGGGTDIFLRFADQGLLQKVDLPANLFQGRIPAQLNGVDLYDPAGRWYGAVLSSFGILSNRWVLNRIGQPEPLQWADLGRSNLRTWVASGDPRLSGSVHMVYEIILQGQGWEPGFRVILRQAANTHSFIGDSGTLTRMVTLGEVAAAGSVDANALIALARDPTTMTYHLPAGETIINPDAIAVLRGAPRLPLARAFVEFVLSDAGQYLFILQPGIPGGPRRNPLCRLSIAETLYSPESLHRYPPAQRSIDDANPFAVKNMLRYDGRQGNRRWNALNDLLGAVVVDAHPDLAAAWAAVQNSRLSEPQRRQLEDELFQPFCTEQELAAHTRRIEEQGPRFRAETVNQWGEEARQRYQRIRRQAEEGS